MVSSKFCLQNTILNIITEIVKPLSQRLRVRLFGIIFGVIIPGLRIQTFPTKFNTVDSIPILEIPPSITFNPGQSEVSFTIEVLLDGIMEGQENIVLDFPLSDPCGNITPVTIELFIQDLVEVTVEINNPEVGCPGENIVLTATKKIKNITYNQF